MAEISRVALFGKLNSLAYRAIEAATVFCKMRGNPYVELVHWFHQILQLQDSDLHKIIKHFQIDPARLVKDLTENLDKLPRGDNRAGTGSASAPTRASPARSPRWATMTPRGSDQTMMLPATGTSSPVYSVCSAFL